MMVDAERDKKQAVQRRNYRIIEIVKSRRFRQNNQARVCGRIESQSDGSDGLILFLVLVFIVDCC